MIGTVKREIAIEKELRSKIEWENALVKYTKEIELLHNFLTKVCNPL